MQLRTLRRHNRPGLARVWLLAGPALVLALAVSVAVFIHSLASPDAPEAIPLPVPLPLSHVPIPEPPDLDNYVADRQAAIQLGKALFWDMQVGSDGTMACASCHFHAGADSRTFNTTNPGPDGNFQAANPNQAIVAGDFPFHDRADPDLQSSPVTRNWDDITGSQGVRGSEFGDIVLGQAVETTIPVDDPVFQVGGTEIRRVTGRNAPTMINAVFNFNNLWDGAANNIFNGINPHGATDPDSKVFVDSGAGMEATLVRIRNAALASQAVGPPMNGNEMSAAGRTFPKLGKKMLSLTPLAQQLVSLTDSVLGDLSASPANGLTSNYADMIQAAFQPQWWQNTSQIVTYQGGVPSISAHPGGTLSTDQYTQMEANFSLFFGLAVQMYESTLVSDQSTFDKVMAGEGAFSPIEELGFAIFQGECAVCHAGSEFTTAAYSNVAFGPGGPPPLVELMTNADFTKAIYDDGYFNIGVTKTTDDLSRGVLDPFGRPLAYSRLGHLKKDGLIPAHYDPFVWELPPNAIGILDDTSNGAFKAPTLRNIELTGPYFHNGGAGTLDQVVDFYTRGGNFPIDNRDDLDPLMLPLPGLVNRPDQQAAIIAFLHTLTDERVAWERAPFDHPSLSVPERANGGNPATDSIITIDAVGAGGRGTRLGAFLQADVPPTVVDDVFEVPFGSSGVVLNVLANPVANDGDLDGQHIVVSSVTSPTLLGGTVTIGVDGLTVVYTPPAVEGNDSFTYTVRDSSGRTTTGNVNVTVQTQGANRPPEALFDQFPIVQANGTGVAVPVLLNDQDLDGNPIFITDVTGSPSASVTIDPVGDQILATPAPGFTGFTTVTYTISDGLATATATVWLKVNDWPKAIDDTFDVRAGAVNYPLTVLNNDIDNNPDDILLVLGFDPIFKGTAQIDPTGTYISYTPFPGVTGVERLTYFVGDGIVADSATVTINIGANSQPGLFNDTFTVDASSADNMLFVLDNDLDPDGDTITIISVFGAAHGQVSIVGGNRLRYTPDRGFFGTDSFTYVATDGQGGVGIATVTVEVVATENLYLPLLGRE